MFARLKQAFSESECRLAREILKTICRSDHGFTAKNLRLSMPGWCQTPPTAYWWQKNSIMCSMR